MAHAKDYTIEQLKKSANRNDILLPHTNHRNVFLRVIMMEQQSDLWKINVTMYILLPTVKGERGDIRLNNQEDDFQKSLSYVCLVPSDFLYLHEYGKIHIGNNNKNIEIKIFDGNDLKKKISITNEEIAQFAWERYISSILLSNKTQNYWNLKYLIKYYGNSLTYKQANSLISLANCMDERTSFLLALWFDIGKSKSLFNKINALVWYIQTISKDKNHSADLWYFMTCFFESTSCPMYWKKYNQFMNMLG